MPLVSSSVACASVACAVPRSPPRTLIERYGSLVPAAPRRTGVHSALGILQNPLSFELRGLFETRLHRIFTARPKRPLYAQNERRPPERCPLTPAKQLSSMATRSTNGLAACDSTSSTADRTPSPSVNDIAQKESGVAGAA